MILDTCLQLYLYINTFCPQTDIFGICPTEVSSSEEGGAVLLHRSRDLSRCGMREQGRHDLYTGVFDPQAVSILYKAVIFSLKI